jgi:hypothetical protein
MSEPGDALRKRPHGCGVAADRAYMPAVKRLDRPRETDLRDVVDADLVYRTNRLPVAPAAKRLSTVHHGARLFLRLARPGLIRADKF